MVSWAVIWERNLQVEVPSSPLWQVNFHRVIALDTLRQTVRFNGLDRRLEEKLIEPETGEADCGSYQKPKHTSCS
jgi:hypothetical protein